jgi:hypothetical protein
LPHAQRPHYLFTINEGATQKKASIGTDCRTIIRCFPAKYECESFYLPGKQHEHINGLYFKKRYGTERIKIKAIPAKLYKIAGIMSKDK